MANSAMERWPAGHFVTPDAKRVWNNELGILLNGMDAVWYNTASRPYYQYAKESIDQLIAPDGSIPSYDPGANSLDDIALGRQLLLLYRVTRDAKYYKVAALLRRKLSVQPRDASGGFWPEQNDQMRLAGFSMTAPFYAEYASIFQEPQDFADITKQFSLIEAQVRSPKKSASASAMGWYMMALVDSLPYYPRDDPGRVTLLAILNRIAAAVIRYQHKETGLWSQVLDRPKEKGNSFEASAACMFTYALQKGVRFGYLPQHDSDNAARAWQGILSHFVQTDANGFVTIAGTFKGTGPGDTPQPDRSDAYNVNSPVVSDDPEGVGAFLLASTEMELAPGAALARGETVMVDAWFNSQQRLNAAGQKEYFHYKWGDYTNDGFALFGHIFASHGAALDTLYSAPTVDNLKGAQYYIIASPDIPVKNPHPHYVQPEDADQVVEWVKQGGVLILMENDPANADIDHLDRIADRFGLHFNDVLSHHVVGDDFAAGRIVVSGGGPLFHDSHTLYMKDTCTLSLKAPATPLLDDKGDIMMATAKYGRGTVFAVVDPWLYNEYTDGRKSPPMHDNYAGGEELVRWLINQRQRETGSPSQP